MEVDAIRVYGYIPNKFRLEWAREGNKVVGSRYNAIIGPTKKGEPDLDNPVLFGRDRALWG